MKSQATIFPSLPGRGIRAIKEMVRLLILLLFFSPALFAQTAVLRGPSVQDVILVRGTLDAVPP